MQLPEATQAKNAAAELEELTQAFIEIISETNGITLDDTLELMMNSDRIRQNPTLATMLLEFRGLIADFQTDQIGIETLLNHKVAGALFEFFRRFPLPYRDEHTHLTGALSAEFVFPRIKKLLEGPNKAIYEKKIVDIYGPSALPIKSIEDVERLLKIKDNERFSRYLSILMLPKLLLVDRQAHADGRGHRARHGGPDRVRPAAPFPPRCRQCRSPRTAARAGRRRR